jgi:hypothetical protein
LAGGVPGQGVGVENVQKRQKTRDFAHILAYKSPKTPFFDQVLNKIYFTPEMFFEEYINDKNLLT